MMVVMVKNVFFGTDDDPRVISLTMMMMIMLVTKVMTL